MEATGAGGRVRPGLMTSASRQLGQTLGVAITGAVLVAGVRGSVAGGYAHAGQAAWWVTAAFGAAIIPLALASPRPATSASQRRTLALPAAAPAGLWLAMAGGPQPPGQAPRRSGVLLPRGLRFRRARSANPDDAVPQADAPAPGPAALHHDRRPAQPSANGTGGSPDAVPQADAPAPGLGPAALHHDRRPAQPSANGTGGSPDDAGDEPQAGPDTYQVGKSTPTTLGQAVPESLPAAGDTSRTLDSQAVAEALASLSQVHRQVIVETYYRGRSVAETAAALGIPAATVKTRTFYALKALKLALQERI